MARIKRVQGNATPLTETVEDTTNTRPSTATTATPPTKKPRRRKRGRTSSERGRAFRKRQDNHEALLEQQVARLQQEIQDKQFLLSVCEAKYLRSKHSVHGPLVAIAVEYFRSFQCDVPSKTNVTTLSSRERDLIPRQGTHFHGIMDPDVVTNGHTDQWRLESLASRGFSMEIVSPPAVIGPDENPIVELQLRATRLIEPEFVDVVFQPPMHGSAIDLLQHCAGKTMKVSVRMHLQFSPEKRINVNIAQVDYVQSFSDLGLSLHQVAELLMVSTVMPPSTVVPAKKRRVKARPLERLA